MVDEVKEDLTATAPAPDSQFDKIKQSLIRKRRAERTNPVNRRLMGRPGTKHR